MFDKWKRNGSDYTTALPSPPLSSSSSSPSSSSSSLPEDSTHSKKYVTLLKKWFTPRFVQKSDPGICYSTPDPRRRSQHPHHYHEQPYQQQDQQKYRWSVDMVQEHLLSPPPRRFTLKFPPPTCGGTFLSTIPEI
ncbi:unnamed protein product [Absidia cylindrospora]